MDERPACGGHDRAVGDVIDGAWRISSPLGRGGASSVYVAEHVRTGQKVALKLLGAVAPDDTQALERFEQEAGALASLAHPNVVRPVDFGQTADGQMYLAMEIADGTGLDKLLARRDALTLAQVLSIIEQLGAALGAAHAVGLVHRDLKPENINAALGPDGAPSVKLLDLGIARVVHWNRGGSKPISSPWVIVGTPAYIAPEQAAGQPVDARADQYSLGVILYEIASGMMPFSALDPIDLLEQQINDPPPPLSLAAPALPAPVAAVIETMLAKSPNERYATIEDAITAFLTAARAHPFPLHGGSLRPPTDTPTLT